MLDDEKKKLIEAEERFRHEIKVKLETENALLKKGVKIGYLSFLIVQLVPGFCHR